MNAKWILVLLALPVAALADSPVVVPKSAPTRTVPLNLEVNGPAVRKAVITAATFQDQFRTPPTKPITDFTAAGALRIVRANLPPLFEPWAPLPWSEAGASRKACRSNEDLLSVFERYEGCSTVNVDLSPARGAQRNPAHL